MGYLLKTAAFERVGSSPADLIRQIMVKLADTAVN